MHRLHGLCAGLPGGGNLTESDVPEKWKPFIAENRDKLAGAANITAKKEPLGKDKPECQPGARKP